MNAKPILTDDPVTVVEQALNKLVATSDKKHIPIASYKPAKGWLKRKGVSFLVILRFQCGVAEETDLVPIRVIEHNPVHIRYGQEGQMSSWKGKKIKDLSLKFCHDLEDVVRHIAKFLLEHPELRNAPNPIF